MSRRPIRVYTVGLALAALVLSAAACGSRDDEANPLITSSPTMSPVTTPATESPEQAAIAAAKTVIPAYFELSDRALSDPNTFDPDKYKTVAISTALVELGNELSVYKAKGAHVLGTGTVVSMGNPRVDLRNKPKATPPDIPTVQMDVCYDVSKVSVVNGSGKSLVPPGRAPRVLKLVGVSNYSYPKADQWRVSFTQTKEGKPC